VLCPCDVIVVSGAYAHGEYNRGDTAIGTFMLQEKVWVGGMPVYRNHRHKWYIYYSDTFSLWLIADAEKYDIDRAAAGGEASFSRTVPGVCPTDAQSSSWKEWSGSAWLDRDMRVKCESDLLSSALGLAPPPPPRPNESGMRFEWWVPFVIALGLLICLVATIGICCFSVVHTFWRGQAHQLGRPEFWSSSSNSKSRLARAMRAMDSSSVFYNSCSGAVRVAGQAGAENKAVGLEDAL